MRRVPLQAIALLALVLTPCFRAFALDPSLEVNQYAHTAWRSREGLPGKGELVSIAQTPDGYLWLATEMDTLLRFDGVRAVPWKPGVQTNVYSLLAARDGTLWMGLESGLASWKDGVLTQYKELDGYVVRWISEDGAGTVWVGSVEVPGGRVCAIREGTARCQGADGSLGRYVAGLCVDGEQLWVYAETGLWQWKPTPTRLPSVGKPEGLFVSRMMCAKDAGRLLISLPDGMKHLVDGKLVADVPPELSTRSYVTAMLRDRDGALWIGTGNQGLIHIREGRVDRFTHADGLSGNIIQTLFEDREGNVWVVTLDGLDRFRNFSVPTLSIDQGLSGSEVWSVLAARDGSLWLADRNGLHRWKDGRMSVYRGDNGPGRRPGSLLEDSHGRLSISTDDGLAVFTNGRFARVSQELRGQVHSLVEDSDGQVWFSEDLEGSQSIGRILDGHVVGRIPRSRLGFEPSFLFLTPDPHRGGLWIGGRQRFAYFRDGEVQRAYGATDGVPEGDVNDLHLDDDGTVWASTDNGLVQLRDGKLRVLTTSNGLPCASVDWLREDEAHTSELLMNCGLLRLPRADLEAWVQGSDRPGSATFLEAQDGVRIRRNPSYGYRPIVTRSGDGKLWFNSLGGASVVDPRRLSKNELLPPVRIEQVTADGILHWQNYSRDRSAKVSLPPGVRDLQIDFTALALSIPEKVRFRYRLEGQDPQWKEVVNDRRVQYSNLKPGDYVFRVVAANESGRWNEAGAALALFVAPAYYQTRWFRALCLIAGLAGLGALYQLRVRRLKSQERQLRAVIEGLPTMAFSFHADGSVDFLNPRWLEYAGLARDSRAAGERWAATIHPEDVDQHLKKWKTSLSTGVPFENEARHRSGSGEYRWFLVQVVPFRDQHGKIVRWYGTLTDIEDRKRAERERETLQADLAHVNRLSMMGELTASLSHEIRQPIAATMSNAAACLRWLKRSAPDLDEASEAAERIVRDGQRAGEIIERLRSLYLKSPPSRDLVDVKETITELLALMQPEARRRSVSIRLELASALQRITADRVQFQQVLMNLMLNAVEAMKESGGELTIRAQPDADGHLRVSVSDTGVGLPANAGEEIFKAFFTTKPQGSGMGLAISRSIVESHGGRLWATANDGPGATFHFSLPVAGSGRVAATS